MIFGQTLVNFEGFEMTDQSSDYQAGHIQIHKWFIQWPPVILYSQAEVNFSFDRHDVSSAADTVVIRGSPQH